MFKKREQKSQSSPSQHNVFDPSHIGDPIAMQIEWTTVSKVATGFVSHKLNKVNIRRLKYRVTIRAIVFDLIFLLAGGAVIVSLFHKLSFGEGSFDMATVFLLLVGFAFVVKGGYMLYNSTAPIVFDKPKGLFRKGRKAPESAELNKIHALQLIPVYRSLDDADLLVHSSLGLVDPFLYYELNLVLENGERINVVAHGSQNILREDARTLSAFLAKPVWDAT